MNYPSPGIHHGVPFGVYRSDDITTADTIEAVKGKAVSKSLIIDFIPDPSAWKNSPPKKQTTAMRGGSLFDTLLTEPDKFESRFVVSEYDKFQSNESKEWRRAMEDAGMSVIKQSELDSALMMLDAVKAKPEAAALIVGAQFQVAYRHATKYPFDSKGLIDLVPADDSMLVDIKTCEPSALESQRSLARHIFDWGYHIQAGAYCEGFSLASGSDRARFKFIFVTSKTPFRVAVVELPFAAIMLGADQYRAGMARFSECLERNYWPSIWDGEVELDLPEYAYTQNQ
jgi:hypothetical protein